MLLNFLVGVLLFLLPFVPFPAGGGIAEESPAYPTLPWATLDAAIGASVEPPRAAMGPGCAEPIWWTPLQHEGTRFVLVGRADLVRYVFVELGEDRQPIRLWVGEGETTIRVVGFLWFNPEFPPRMCLLLWPEVA